ncbi:MAG: Prolipoprotein diacylglyceryl transferase [Chloroflexi bacterium]|nr:Prolipoprotein diacylglyceryl transferase [Chloroflexota bacterium]
MWYYCPVSIQKLPQFLSLFSILTTAGAILGLLLTAWRASERKIFYLDAGIGLSLGALLGARGGFVLRNWAYFTANAPEIPQIWLGGLSWPGALLGGLLALGLISLVTKHHPGKLADALLPLLGTLAFSAWLACWGEGCAYGPPAEGWWTIPVRDQFGAVGDRWPLQPVAAVLSAGLILGVELLRDRNQSPSPGQAAILSVGGISLINLVVSLLRVDPAPYLWRLRWESWFTLIFTIAAAVAFFALGEEAEEPEEPKEPSSGE